MFANRNNTKKLVKKLTRIEGSSVCRQLFANAFIVCFYAIHTKQLEFANTMFANLSMLWEGCYSGWGVVPRKEREKAQ